MSSTAKKVSIFLLLIEIIFIIYLFATSHVSILKTLWDIYSCCGIGSVFNAMYEIENTHAYVLPTIGSLIFSGLQISGISMLINIIEDKKPLRILHGVMLTLITCKFYPFIASVFSKIVNSQTVNDRLYGLPYTL